jgi:hypothetical protein
VDGGLCIDAIDFLAETYGKGLWMDGQKDQSFQSATRAGWRRFSLAVQRSSMPNRPKATMYGVNGIDIIGEFA